MSGVKGHASSTAGSSASRFTHAYNLQYISVIMIILTFVIGAFVRPHGAAARGAVPPAAESGGQPPQIGVMELERLFLNDGTLINPELLAALRSVLMNHDVNARFEIFGERETWSAAMGGSYDLALARSSVLLRALRAQGVPAEALRVVAAPGTGGSQGRVEFYRAVGGQ